MMYFPTGHAILDTEPLGRAALLMVGAIALGLAVLSQPCKRKWRVRRRLRPHVASAPGSQASP